MFDKYTCPECNGFGWITYGGDDEPRRETCWYCGGIGMASDDDPEEHFYHYDDL